MESQTVFAALRDALAVLYPVEQDARVVVDDAGLNAMSVTFSTRPQTNWHNILTEALRQSRLDALLYIAHRDYMHNQLLITAYADYRRWVAAGGRFETPAALFPSDSSTQMSEGSNPVAGHDEDSLSERVNGDTTVGDKLIGHHYAAKAHRTRIVLTIEGEIESFSQQDRERLQRIIAEVLNMSEPITIHKIEPGSIKVTLELPLTQAEELHRIVRSGQLREYGIIDVALLDAQPIKAEIEEIQLLAEEQLTQFRLAASGRRSISFVPPKISISNYESEAEFIARLKAGDEFAWQTLTTGEYSTRLYNHLRHRLPNQQAVEDVLHDTFASAVRAIPNFDGKVKLSTFLFSLAQHKLADFWRRYSETIELEEVMVGPGLSSESIEFIETLQKLKEEHRQALVLRYYVGLGVDEIATILGKTYRGAESLLSRARAELRMAMGHSSNI